MRKRFINEVTSNSTSKGSYVSPLLPGLRDFGKPTNAPYTEYINDYDSALLDYDAQDGRMSTSKKKIKSIEKKAEKITNFIKNNPDSFAWGDEAGIINSIPKQNTDAKPTKATKKAKVNKLESIERAIKSVLQEVTSTSMSRGSFLPPLQPGIRYFDKKTSEPYTNQVSKYKSPDLEYDSYDNKMERTKKQIGKEEKIAKKIYNTIKKNPFSTFSDEDGNVINQTPGRNKTFVPIKEWLELDKINLNEDLAVWFGKKKKPKGSKQPKGPWVDICRKVNGKHPPCGRSDADKGKYPKCRAAGVAGKMSDSAKKAACRQKRNAEKQDTQTGKGQKPIMTSYKPKKNIKENIMNRRRMINESDVRRLVRRVLNESAPTAKVDLQCVNTTQNKSRNFYNMKVVSEKNVKGGIGAGGHIELFLEREKTVLAGGVVLQDGATVGASNLKLDLVPTENVSKYANPQISQDKLANPNNAFNAVFMIGHSENVSYFCRIAADPENKWEEYIYTL